MVDIALLELSELLPNSLLVLVKLEEPAGDGDLYMYIMLMRGQCHVCMSVTKYLNFGNKRPFLAYESRKMFVKFYPHFPLHHQDEV